MTVWVHPDYERIVRADGGITYRQRAERRDIIDEIDALVDEQLAAGESVGGYESLTAASNPDPQYPHCWHCGRHWHGLPITARVAAMYRAGEFDEDYRVDTDHSRVLCRGSEFIGPMPQEGFSTSGGNLHIDVIPQDAPDWLRQTIDSAINYAAEQLALIPGLSASTLHLVLAGINHQRWWRYQTPLGAAADAAARDIGTNFHQYTGGPAMAHLGLPRRPTTRHRAHLGTTHRPRRHHAPQSRPHPRRPEPMGLRIHPRTGPAHDGGDPERHIHRQNHPPLARRRDRRGPDDGRCAQRAA